MASGQPYVRWVESKRCWRFRRRVPGHLRDLIGQTEWIKTLPARNQTEADRLAIPHIDETNRIIQLAEKGNWPPIGDDGIETLAIGWWEWFRGGADQTLDRSLRRQRTARSSRLGAGRRG